MITAFESALHNKRITHIANANNSYYLWTGFSDRPTAFTPVRHPQPSLCSACKWQGLSGRSGAGLRVLSTTRQERFLESKSRQRAPGESRKSHQKGRKHKAMFERGGKLNSGSQSPQKSRAKRKETTWISQVLGGYEDKNCFICNERDGCYQLTKNFLTVRVANISTTCLGRF